MKSVQAKTKMLKTAPRRREMDRRTRDEIERFLMAKHAALNGSIQNLLAERGTPAETRSADMLDSAAEIARDHIQVALIDRLRPQADQVGAALERLSRGEYGFCRDCGEFIGVPRLRAVPFAQRCTPCQSRAEGRAERALRPAA